jgi:isoleucyl-tRNA synthetase
MSKSLRNYPDPMEVFSEHGSDAMRWYLLSSPILRGGDFSVTEQGIRETVRQVLLPLWNSWYFLALYANAAGVRGTRRTDSDHVLDRYILSKLSATTSEVTAAMDRFDLFAACQEIRTFLDVLTNWYIRRSRDRFWRGDADAIDTLHTVLSVTVAIAAPLLPMVTERIHEGLSGPGASVHLGDWPDADLLPRDEGLVEAMDMVREVCSAALGVRKSHGRRVRLPLASLTVASPRAASLEPFAGIIADEVNVKAVHLGDDASVAATQELQVTPAVIGPRLGPRTQAVIGAVKRGEWERVGDDIHVAGERLGPGDYTLRLVTGADSAAQALSDGESVVMLDVQVTAELEAEGLARDLVRVVQQARREARLDVSDRIRLVLGADDGVRERLEPHMALVADETLATVIEWDPGLPRDSALEGASVGVAVHRAP